MLDVLVVSAEDMEDLGAQLARASPPQAVIYLYGDLGAGKTTLARGFLRALGHTGAVKSPTYTLIEIYSLLAHTVYHLDLYRLGDSEELEYLGLRDLLAHTALWLVEWPEHGADFLPGADVQVHIRYVGNTRAITLSASSARGRLLLQDFAKLPSVRNYE
jgi:tRNA threonylcarbamoyladenosine biosynthesis protein TsaE